jgi:hypothetical protein
MAYELNGWDSIPGMGKIFFFFTAFTASGPNQTPIQLVAGALSLGVMWPGREAHHSIPVP